MDSFKVTNIHTTKMPGGPTAPVVLGRAASYLCVALAATFTLAACDMPATVGPELTDEATVSGYSAASMAPSAVVVDPDGSVRAISGNEEGIAVGNASDRRLAVVIAGRAAYAGGHVSQLRLNVRQSRDGTISGGGVATIYGQEVGLTPECIKPISSFGTTFYGVNVAFSDPIVRTTPWGTVSYTHGALSVADGGDLANLVTGNGGGCYAAALRYPYEPVLGRITVNLPGE